MASDKGVVSRQHMQSITQALKDKWAGDTEWAAPTVAAMGSRIADLHISHNEEEDVEHYSDLPESETNNLKIYKVKDNQTYYYYDKDNGWQPVGNSAALENWDEEAFPMYLLSYTLDDDTEYGHPSDMNPSAMPEAVYHWEGDNIDVINVTFTSESTDPDGEWSLNLDENWAESAGHLITMPENNLLFTGEWIFTPTEESEEEETA